MRGTTQRLPVNRLFFVGRNYHAHAVEMGRPVDKSVERPFYFTKSPQTLVESGATVAYPSETKDFQHEMELVVVIGRPGLRVTKGDAKGAAEHLRVYLQYAPPSPAADSVKQRLAELEKEAKK